MEKCAGVVKYVQWITVVYTDSPNLFQTLIVHQHKRAWELINKDHIIVISMQDKNSSSLVRIIMGTR